jgi:hypothetical protein
MLVRTVQLKLMIKEKQENVCHTVNKTREAALKVSYALSHVNSSYSRPYIEGQFIKECLIKTVKITLPSSSKKGVVPLKCSFPPIRLHSDITVKTTICSIML